MSRHHFSLATLRLGLLVILPILAFITTQTRADNLDAQQFRFGPQKTFPTSLHGSRSGHITLYSKHFGGLETLTDIPIEELGCLQCHDESGIRADGTGIDTESYEPSCADCHDSTQGHPGPVDDPAVCLGCHRRQAGEVAAQLPDVHRDAGFTCTNCHTKSEMHGDGNLYSSLLAPGAKKVACEDCHLDADDPASPPSLLNPYHKIHAKRVDCSVCHAKTVFACTNCHVPGIGQPIGIHQGFKMLVQGTGDDSEVHAASYMSITTDEDKTFYSIVPRHTHSIVRNGVSSCKDCHFNEIVQQYLADGTITVLGNKDDQPVFAKGIIPIPENWKDALQFAFWKSDNGTWEFLKNEADQSRLIFAMPLSERQMQILGHDYEKRSRRCRPRGKCNKRGK